MAVPENIKKFRPKGTEIQEHNGRYYVYKVKAYYDPETKKSKRKSEGCIGQIYEDIGFVSNPKSRSSNNTVKEFGATAFLTGNSTDVKNILVNVFGSDGFRIYSLAVLKLLNNTNRKNMDICYRRSFISEMFPDVHLSKNTLTDFMDRLGLLRQNMLQFFYEIRPETSSNIIFDGSSFCSSGRNNPYINRGYNPNNPKARQVRLIYGFDTDNSVPVYFNVVPGNVTDKMAFVASLKESGLKDCTLVLDNGFYSEKNLKYMSSERVDFILPLSSNLNVVKNFDLHIFENTHDHFFYHKRTVNYTLAEKHYLGKYNVYVYYDVERRRELMNNYYARSGIKEDELDAKGREKLDEATRYYGVTFLVTSSEIGAEKAYRQYKKRWNIEEMFDTHKNTLCFDMNYEVKESSQCGWAFIEFVALMIYMKAQSALNSHVETQTLEVHDALLRYGAIVKCKIGNEWETWNLDLETKKQLELLTVNLD